MLLIVDDAERLTEAESNLLATLVTRLPERTLVAVCFRDPPGSRHPPLADLLGRGGVYELTRLVSLDALGHEDLGALVASMHPLDPEVPPAFVEALWQRTAGNPFFAREVLRDLDPADLRLADSVRACRPACGACCDTGSASCPRTRGPRSPPRRCSAARSS